MNKRKQNRVSILIAGLLAIMLLVWGCAPEEKQPQATTPQNNGEQTPTDAAQPPTEVAQASAYTGELSQLTQKKCLTCHATDGQRVERISDIRKTPEGWDATIYRMEHSWGLQITPEEKKQLVQDLSKTNGLAPSEMESVMYWVTKRGSTMEDIPDPRFEQTCIRCHSLGQPFAQRRTPEEWDKLKDFHVAYNPSQLYQVRDVDWDEVSAQLLKYLAEKYPFDNPEYNQWKQSGKALNPSGNWRIVGISPKDGMYSGNAVFSGEGDAFTEERTVEINGVKETNKGQATLYSGYSLRVSQDGQQRYRGYYNIGADGKTIVGSRVVVGDNGLYADETYYAADGKQLFDLWPRSVKKGQTTVVHLIGNQLPEGLTLKQITTDQAISISKIVRQQGDDLWLEVKANQTAEQATIGIADVENKLSLRVYDKVDFLKITPEFGLGRIQLGEHRQSVQFQANAYLFGPDGKPGTADDILLGPVPVKWSMKEYLQGEENDHDLAFIGKLDADTGLFTPAAGGPNPKREYSTNNTGSVNVVATYQEPGSKKVLNAEAFLLSTVPDFVTRIQ